MSLRGVFRVRLQEENMGNRAIILYAMLLALYLVSARKQKSINSVLLIAND